MRSVPLILLSVLMLGACDKFSSEPASLDEITKVVDALRAAGCTGLKELEVERDGFEVDGVVCNDGNVYDIKLDKAFNIVSKRRDYI
jgi:Peptidase propeptide and YPEB domain